jgi:hypothetical protein
MVFEGRARELMVALAAASYKALIHDSKHQTRDTFHHHFRDFQLMGETTVPPPFPSQWWQNSTDKTLLPEPLLPDLYEASIDEIQFCLEKGYFTSVDLIKV